MCSSGKSLTKTRFTSLFLKRSSGTADVLFAPVSRRLSHQNPAWHIVDRQQIYLVLESLDARLEPRAVRDAPAPFPLELVRREEHLEVFTFSVGVAVQALPRAWSSGLRCPDGFCLPFAPHCQG